MTNAVAQGSILANILVEHTDLYAISYGSDGALVKYISKDSVFRGTIDV